MIVDLVVKATLLLAAAWGAAFVLRRRAASTRHAVWVGLLAATLLLPAIAMLAPSITLPLLPARIAVAPPAMRVQPESVPSKAIGILASLDRDRASAPRVSSNLSSVGAAVAPSPDVPRASLLTPRNMLLGAWLFVALVLALRIVRAHLQARRLLRACTDPSERLEAAVESVSASLGVAAPLLRIAPAGMMPAVIGVRRPAIMLPAEAGGWSDERLELVLLHECAHVRRRDAIMQVVAGLATSAYWWHPLAWVAARHIVRERELACDDLVIASGTPVQRYAEHLLDIARSMKSSRQPALAALAMARPSQLEGRLIALLEERPRGARPARALATGLVLALVAVSAIAPLRLVARAVTTDEIRDGGLAAESSAQATAPASSQAAAPVTVPAQQPGQTAEHLAIDPALYDALVKALKDIDEGVRTMAVSALASNVKEYERLIALIAPMLEDKSADVRAAAVGSLLKTESPQASTVLLKALQDSDPDVRQLALAGLVRLDRQEVVPYLAAALKDAEEDVRATAVLGIDGLNHPQKLALLLQAAADASEDVRSLAAFALADETGADVPAILAKLAQDPSADVRQAAVMAIASMARRADVDPLLASLRDRDADVRAAAAIGLGSIADKAALPGLTQALRDADADVRSAAAIALGSLSDPAALQALTAALGDVDADVRKSAITAAAAIGGDFQARTNVTATLAGTVAGTIHGTLSGTLWGGAHGYSGRSSDEHERPAPAVAAGTVQLGGWVKDGGAFPWKEGLTVGALVAQAGGLAEGGTFRGARVTRRENGKVITIDGDEKMLLRERDIVTIRRQRQ